MCIPSEINTYSLLGCNRHVQGIQYKPKRRFIRAKSIKRGNLYIREIPSRIINSRKDEHQIQRCFSWLQRCISSTLLLSSHTLLLVPPSAAETVRLRLLPASNRYSLPRNDLQVKIINQAIIGQMNIRDFCSCICMPYILHTNSLL